jgi:nucleoid DNA-binding protein
MWQNFSIAPALTNWQIWMAQMPVQRTVETPEEASVLFSGPQFFVALIAGVVLAFAFQLLLTNLSVAAGISFLGHQNNSDKPSQDQRDNADSFGDTINKIGVALGLGTLITVTIAIFIASLLAVKLSLIISPGLGAIVGLVIWATYFTLLVWVSSTTVGSLVGSVVNTATSGFQALFGTAAAALGAQAAKKQMVSTAEAAAAAIRRELGSAIDPISLRETVEDYLSALKPPELDLTSVRQQFENILNDPQLREIATSGDLPNLDRQTFVNLVSARSDLSKREVNSLADQLESTWKQATGRLQKSSNQLDDLVNYLKSANPADLLSNQLSDRLEQLVDELRQRRQAQQPNMFQQGMTMGLNSLMGVVLGRTDLSDFDVEKILGQLKSAQEKVSDQAGKVTTQLKGDQPTPYSTLKADAENYVFNARSWKMNRATIDRDFRDVLYDPAANPAIIRHDLEQLSRSDFVDWLSQRGLFTQAKIQELANDLEGVRLSVLYTVAAEEEQENTQQMLRQVAYYLRVSPKENLNEASFEQQLKPMLKDDNAGYEQIRARMEKLDRPTIIKMLAQRQDLTQDEARAIILQIEAVRDRVVAEVKEQDEQAAAQLVAVRQNLESYLRSTGKRELNPDGIKRDVKMLLSDPNAGIWALRARAERFDRDTFVKLLATREDISEAEAHRIVDQVESTWNSLVYTPKAIADQAKEQYDKVMGSIADYLRSTGKSELNPDGIKRDLAKLLDDPRAGASAIRYRLSQMDRDTLVQLLAQRNDMTEAQANEIVDSVQQTIRDIVRTPRRVATRVQQQMSDFQSSLEDYLRSTGKDELNPEGIKRDISLLLHDPSVGAMTLKDRLTQFDRSTIVALLSQREDISEAEANRIVDQILSVRDQFVAQIQNIQARIQSVIDMILANIRNYLNSLNRPELNYDGIKRDVRKLFNDPEAGFDAMRDRLGQFNRDTLVAIMSSREDISEADANRIIDQIESARNNVLYRAEQLQLEAQRRLEEVRQEALRRGEETRKAAESAAWWLFFTALVSAIAAAGAGAIAVAG